MLNIKKYNRREELFSDLIIDFRNRIRQAIQQKGIAKVGFSGGSSPLPFFRLLASVLNEEDFWEKVHVFWVDERYVPYDDPQSNYGAFREIFPSDTRINFHPIPTDCIKIGEAADIYQEVLEKYYDGQQLFDWVLLGAGADGHTASVFKEDLKRADKNKGHLVFATKHPVTDQSRISLNLPLLYEAEEVALLLFGDDKRDILKQISAGSHSESLPISVVAKKASIMNVYTDLGS